MKPFCIASVSPTNSSGHLQPGRASSTSEHWHMMKQVQETAKPEQTSDPSWEVWCYEHLPKRPSEVSPLPSWTSTTSEVRDAAHGIHSCIEDRETVHVLNVKDFSWPLLPPGLCVPCSNTTVLQDGTDTSLCARNGTEAPSLSSEAEKQNGTLPLPNTLPPSPSPEHFLETPRFRENAVTISNPSGQIPGSSFGSSVQQGVCTLSNYVNSSLAYKKARLTLTDLLTHN